MTSNYWLKLYHEMLDDPKVMTLRPALRWRFVETLLVAGEMDQDGLLPPVDKYAWRVRDRAELVETEFNELSDAGLLSREDERWLVTKFAERQRARTSAERVRRYRERQKKQEYYEVETGKEPRSNGAVTFRYTDIDKDKEVDIDEIRAPVRAFCESTSRPMPDLDPDSDASVEFWLIPGCYFLSLTEWEKDGAAGLVTATVEYMDRNGLSYKNLASLVNVARTVKSMANGHGKGDRDALLDEVDAYSERRIEFTELSKQAQNIIHKMGGQSNVQGVSEKDMRINFYEAYNEVYKNA